MSLAAAIGEHLLAPGASDPTADDLAGFIAEAGGDDLLGVLFYGSRKTGAAPGPWSAYDFFVLTRTYTGFYKALRGSGRLRRGAQLVSALNAILPPNQISLRKGAFAESALAKCSVIRLDTLERETSPRRRDHFCAGRLFQPTHLTWVSDEAVRERIVACVVSAHEATWDWVRPWLPKTFGAAEYCRTALAVSLAHEFRPEPAGRSDALFEAQRQYLEATYGIWLSELAKRGALGVVGGGLYALADPPTAADKRRIEGYFRRSKRRATERWFKYMMTFDDWLDYLVRKAERHSGQAIELTNRERRWPLVFLWPRVVRYLRHKDRRTAER